MNQESRRQRRSEWLLHVSRWETSGLSQSSYCRTWGLKPKVFNAWVARSRANREGVEGLPQDWVAVKVEPSPCETGLVLRGDGWSLSLPEGICPSWLGRLLGALR